MKKVRRSLFVTVFLILSVSSQSYSADPVVATPKMINLQAVLVDDGGNVLYDKQEADIVFSIVDGDGETLYEEVQHVPIVNGAISVLIGNGKNVATGEATGGIPMEALLPDGSKLLRIKLNEQSIPQEDLQLVSVPYALYAESLSHPIESDEVLDGTLVQADLSTELVSSLENSMTTLNTNSLTTHRTETGAHPARSISVENNFTHASGTDLQSILSGLDSAIGARRNQEGELIEDVGDEITARTAADTAEATTRAAGDDEVRASEISRAGDTIYGDLTFYTDDTLATQTMSIAPTTGDITTQGQVSALGGMFTIELDPVSSEPIISIDNTGGVETYRFEAETGSLTLLGDLTVADADILMSPGRLVDGVDISALDLRVGAVEIRLPPGGTPLDDIYVNETGDTMTGPLTATSFSGDGSALTALNGSNISSGTVADNRIADSLTRDSELSDHADDTTGVHGVGEGSVVGTTLNQTLSNKTLSSPILRSDDVVLSLPVNGGTQQIVGSAASQTLTNKTLRGASFEDAAANPLNVDLDASNDLTMATDFGGDLSGKYNTMSVANDSHSHTGNTLDFTADPDGAGELMSIDAHNDARYVHRTGDTMTCDTNGDGVPDADPCLEIPGDLTMGSTADINMSEGRTVDTVDVSDLEDRVGVLEREEPETDPTFNSVQITGGAPATPVVQRLYQQSLVSAWARVDASLVSATECSGDGLAGSLNISCIQRLAGGRYQLNFARPVARGGAMAVPSYAVIGNTFGEGIDDIVVVRSTRGTDFTVDIREPAGGSSDADFMIIVVGWNL